MRRKWAKRKMEVSMEKERNKNAIVTEKKKIKQKN